MRTCKEVSRLLSDALDRDLSVGQRLGLGLHLALCGMCRRYARQMRFLRQAVRLHLGRDSATARSPMPDEVRTRLRATLQQASPPADPGRPEAPPS